MGIVHKTRGGVIRKESRAIGTEAHVGVRECPVVFAKSQDVPKAPTNTRARCKTAYSSLCSALTSSSIKRRSGLFFPCVFHWLKCMVEGGRMVDYKRVYIVGAACVKETA